MLMAVGARGRRRGEGSRLLNVCLNKGRGRRTKKVWCRIGDCVYASVKGRRPGTYLYNQTLGSVDPVMRVIRTDWTTGGNNVLLFFPWGPFPCRAPAPSRVDRWMGDGAWGEVGIARVGDIRFRSRGLSLTKMALFQS
jgi:hypothetical protein